jgi:phage repressor protein C with HTH and peptisase S24 domain
VVNKSAIADALNYKRSAFSEILNYRTNVGIELVSKFCELYNVSLEWIIYGRGEIKKVDNILEEPNTRYLQRSDVMQKNQMIPLFNIEAAAGLVELFQHVNEKTPIDFLSIPNLPKCDGAVFVTGDSMYPLLKSGDIVIYKQVHNIEEGIFYGEMYLISLAMDGEEYISVKYIQKSDLGDDYIKLVSKNGHHQPKDIHKNRIRALAMVKASVRINAMR